MTKEGEGKQMTFIKKGDCIRLQRNADIKKDRKILLCNKEITVCIYVVRSNPC